MIYKLNCEEEVNFLFVKKNFILASTKSTKFMVFELFSIDETINENEYNSADKLESESLITELDLSQLKRLEIRLEIPVKKIMKIKILKYFEENRNLEGLHDDVK